MQVGGTKRQCESSLFLVLRMKWMIDLLGLVYDSNNMHKIKEKRLV